MKPSKAQREATYRYDKKVYDRILVRLRGGMEIEQDVKEAQVKWCS